MPLTFSETPLYYKDSQGNYHRVLSGADMTGYRTASAQDVIDTAQDADIASRAKTDEIGIVITGSRPSMAVSPGQYVIVRDSTITDITDGLYINSSSGDLSPSTDVTAADLTPVSGGGLNDLYAVLPLSSATSSVQTDTYLKANNGFNLQRYGNVVCCSADINLSDSFPVDWAWHPIFKGLPHAVSGGYVSGLIRMNDGSKQPVGILVTNQGVMNANSRNQDVRGGGGILFCTYIAAN